MFLPTKISPISVVAFSEYSGLQAPFLLSDLSVLSPFDFYLLEMYPRIWLSNGPLPALQFFSSFYSHFNSSWQKREDKHSDRSSYNLGNNVQTAPRGEQHLGLSSAPLKSLLFSAHPSPHQGHSRMSVRMLRMGWGCFCPCTVSIRPTRAIPKTA